MTTIEVNSIRNNNSLTLVNEILFPIRNNAQVHLERDTKMPRKPEKDSPLPQKKVKCCRQKNIKIFFRDEYGQGGN